VFHIYLSIALLVVARLAKNSAQSFFTTLQSINNLQSEQLGWLVLDQFDALNPPAPSILP
jgi:hypothetical protein